MVTRSVSARSARSDQSDRSDRRRLPWAFWRRQLLAILRLELRKSFFGGRGIGLYLLALLPLAIPFLMWVRLFFHEPDTDVAATTTAFAWMYQYFILHFLVFLGCIFVFGNVMRREVLDRTLHYYFLSPVRRELIVAAKYLTGALATTIVFGLSTVVTFVAMYVVQPGGEVFFTRGPGLGHLAAYLLVTVLGCIGYGAMFLAFGFFFRSPIIPALALFGWEFLHSLLPPLLKKITVIHYLLPLCPVPLSQGPLAILSDAPSPWVAIPGLLILSILLVAVSTLRVRKMEISYEED
jgi:ABC-type transport system involved in multi-copper enzyme maturation permease subunit